MMKLNHAIQACIFVPLVISYLLVLSKSIQTSRSVTTSCSKSTTLDDGETLFRTNPPVEPLQCLDLQLDIDVRQRERPLPEQVDKCLLYSKPSLYIHTMMQMLVGTPNQMSCRWGNNCQPPYGKYQEIMRQYGNDHPPFGYTMIGKARMENLRAAIEEVDRHQIPGAIIEMGVWRGGAMMLAAAMQKQQQHQQPRDIFLFDAFEAISNYETGIGSFLVNSVDDVRSNFQLFNLDGPNIHYVRGLFRDTISKWTKGTPIAVLRVDGNFYDSYQDALYSMYEDVPVGGIVIFDDVMSHPSVMQCWLDFKEDQPQIVETLNRIDTHSAWFRKRVAVKLDHSKKRPPHDVNKEPAEKGNQTAFSSSS